MLVGLFWTKIFIKLILYTVGFDAEVNLNQQTAGIHLTGDFQQELGCTSDWDPNCNLTGFKEVNGHYQLELHIPAGIWSFKLVDGIQTFGRNGIQNGNSWTISLSMASHFLFVYFPADHQLKFGIINDKLESRSLAPLPEISLTDTLIFDPNGNMVANPGDSIKYTIILRNETGQSVLNSVITHSGDPNVTYDPNSLRASPLAFNDTFQFLVNPLVLAVPGVLNNDFDLNDPLPNPPFYTNLFIHRVESNQANVGNSITTHAGGTITLNMDGSLTYDSTGVNGAIEDSIHYTIKDAEGFEDSAVIFIQFNLPPVIASNLAATDTICAFEQMDTFLLTPAFTIMDDELNTESAKISICNNYSSTEDTLIAGSLPGGITAMWTEGTGTLMLMGSASLADYETAIESIQYTNQSNNPNAAIRTICVTVFDGTLNSNQVTRLLKIKPLNDCPTAVRDSISILENGPIPSFSVLTNDSDPDLDVLTVTKINNGMTLSGVAINGGTVGLDATTGNINFVHTTGFNGLDSLSEGEMFLTRFGYSINDGLCEDSDSVIIKITGVNDAPLIASNLSVTDTICAFEQRDTVLMTTAFTLLDDESNIESAQISICNNYLASEDTLIAPALPGGITSSWNDAMGIMTLMGSASKADYEAAVESIQYTNQSNTPNMTPRRICITVNDGDLPSNQVTRELKIKPVNDCPTAVRDSILILENGPIPVYSVLTNDSDLDLDVLSVTKINNGMTLSGVMINGGTVGLNATTGNISFAHTTGFGGLDSLSEGEMFLTRFGYSISDGGCEVSDSVIIKITGVNDAPIIASNLAATDTICAFEQRDTVLMTSAFTLLDDEANIESAQIFICNNYLVSEDTLIVPALPGGITFSWNDATGTITLMGSATKANYETAIESIQYTNQSNTPNMTPRRICITVNDGDLASNQVTRELKVKPVNDCPIAVRDTFMVNENAAFPASNVLTNDTDLEGDVLTATPIVNGMVNGGTVNLNSAGSFTFTHTTGPTGLDTLNVGEMFFARTQYTMSDGLCSDNDSVIIKITGVNDAPVADSNAYTITQTAILTITAPGLLADDDDIDHNSTITVAAVKGVPGNVGSTITLPSGAELTVNANGSFTYNPKCLVAGIDTFSYQIKDEHNLFSNAAIVYINVSQVMWFVDANAGTMGTGSFSNPFDQLTDAQTASGTGDYIFVFPGTYGQSITLKNNQKLIGADENWNCPSGSTIRTASGTSIINGTITLAQNDTIRGIELGNNVANQPLLVDNGSSVLNLVISNTNFANTTTSSGFKIAHGGNLNVTFDSFNSTSPAGEAIYLNNTTGSVTISSGNINTGAGTSDTVFVVIGGTVTSTINASIAQPNAFPLVSVSGGHATGSITFQTGTLNVTNGTGLQFDNADGTYNFNGTNTMNGGDAGIDILNGSSGAFSFSSNSSITNPSGTSFNMLNSDASGSYSGSISDNTGLAISIDNHNSNTFTFQTGTITSTGTGIVVTNCSGGTINFNNPSIQLSTGTSTAVNLTANGGSTIAFATGTGAGLDISTTSGTGFNATGGATAVNVTGNGNTISSTTGAAMNVVGSTIGAANLNFVSISSNGATNGILLNNTGSTGGLTVIGAGSVGSGGTIQNCTGAGISITSASKTNLFYMNIQGGGDDGIIATNAAIKFSLSNCLVTNNGNSTSDDGIAFINVTDTVNITNCSFTNNAHNNFALNNSSGTLSAFTMSGCTLSTHNNSGNFGNHGMLFDLTMNAIVTAASITSSAFSNNKVIGMQVLTGDNSTISSFIVDGCTFSDTGLGFSQEISADFSTAGTSDMTYQFINNTITGHNSHGFNTFTAAGAGTGGSLNATISGNTIGTQANIDSGSKIGNGMRININGGAVALVKVDNNIIRQVPTARGIEAIARNGTGGASFIITNNTVTAPTGTTSTGCGPGVLCPLAPIYVQTNDVTIGNSACSRVSGNTAYDPTAVAGFFSEYSVYLVESNVSTLTYEGNVALTALQNLTNANPACVTKGVTGMVTVVAPNTCASPPN